MDNEYLFFMGHTYIEKLFVAYLNLRFRLGILCFYLLSLATPFGGGLW